VLSTTEASDAIVILIINCDELEVYGCTYDYSLNYNPDATADDGSCEVDYSFSNCPSDLDGNGIVGAQDLLLFLSVYGLICE